MHVKCSNDENSIRSLTFLVIWFACSAQAPKNNGSILQQVCNFWRNTKEFYSMGGCYLKNTNMQKCMPVQAKQLNAIQ